MKIAVTAFAITATALKSKVRVQLAVDLQVRRVKVLGIAALTHALAMVQDSNRVNTSEAVVHTVNFARMIPNAAQTRRIPTATTLAELRSVNSSKGKMLADARS